MNTLVAVIDDDDAVRIATCALLKRLGYEVRDYTSGAARRSADGPPVQPLPDEFITHLRAGGTPAVVITGNCDTPRQPGTKVLYKPMNDADLIACMKAVWRGRNLRLS